MRTAVVTIAHGRGHHLRRQLDGLSRSTRSPEMHVVVAVDDPATADVVAASGSQAHVLAYDVAADALPIAAARNAGAQAALHRGAEVLVFLDVDCIPSPHMVARYHAAVVDSRHGNALLCGPVTYLAPASRGGYPTSLEHVIDPHPARPAPPVGNVFTSTDYALFWSLSFAVTASTWRRIGGFCARYRGYGAEDTDFAQMASAAAIPMRWVGGAHAFHQFHPVSDPPVEHLHDIVRNAEIFHQRWGWWPMEGWLTAFHERGLVTRDENGLPIIC
jgi:GT2 family glycosyltransferase